MEENSSLRTGNAARPAQPFTEDWHVERHDHDDGVISYEIWGCIRGEYSFLFHIYERPFVDEAQRLADFIVSLVNAYADPPNQGARHS